MEDGYKLSLAEVTHKRRLERDADRDLDAEEEHLARGGRKDMTYADLLALPKPVWILHGILTQGFHGLAADRAALGGSAERPRSTVDRVTGTRRPD